jgi:cytidylate kinase
MIVAIDGPAGAGKSTAAKLLAERLSFAYLDTGSMYRAVTLKVLRKKIDPRDEARVAAVARDCRIHFVSGKIFLDDEDVSEAIRRPLINTTISPIAANLAVRDLLVKMQREIGAQGNYVAEGRDTATVVFPEAEFKFYLDARLDERAARRHRELTDKGLEIKREQIEEEVSSRDQADRSRSVGALKRAPGSRYLDTTNLNIEQVVDTLYKIVRRANNK